MADRYGVELIIPPRAVDSAPVQLSTPGLWSSNTESAQYAGYLAWVLRLPFIPDPVIAAGYTVESGSAVVTLVKEVG